MYKSGSALGLVGAITGTVFTVFSLLGILFVAFFLNLFHDFFEGAWHFYIFEQRFDTDNLIGTASGIIVIFAMFLLLLSTASIILGFVGSSKLKHNERKGGATLIVASVFAFLSVISFIPFLFFLVGGIMTFTKKESVAKS